jgi:predicted aldo/keto reductase-like oxidoreductase
MLETDLDILRNFKPMTAEERDKRLADHPVLGNSVCRQCDLCLPCPEGIPIPDVFRCEGWCDRQMRDRKPRSTPDYALRERLCFWFDNRSWAVEEYSRLKVRADACTSCGECVPRCPYGLQIIEKLEYTHFKLRHESKRIPS